jgi:TetR/AcrR family transcriptional regulator, transcriptional repressor for nem operon
MTNSSPRARSGKRERLVSSAAELLHSQGVERTTLAQIAEAAAVPPGNVYYYFKTRDELVAAVIESRIEEVRTLLGSLDKRSTPSARLKALARNWGEASEIVAEHGCPIGSLTSELNKQGGDLDQQAARLFGMLLDWAQDQFSQLGRKDARELATTLLSTVQGATLLANTFRDPDIMRSQVRRLERWIDTL